MENSAQPRYVFLRQQAGPARRLQRDDGDHNSSNENYRAVAREIVAKALEDKVSYSKNTDLETVHFICFLFYFVLLSYTTSTFSD